MGRGVDEEARAGNQRTKERWPHRRSTEKDVKRILKTASEKQNEKVNVLIGDAL